MLLTFFHAFEADYSEHNVGELEPKDVEDSEPESEVKEPEPGVEEISLRPLEVVELPIEILVDLPTEPSMNLVPTMAGMKTSFFS